MNAHERSKQMQTAAASATTKEVRVMWFGVIRGLLSRGFIASHMIGTTHTMYHHGIGIVIQSRKPSVR